MTSSQSEESSHKIYQKFGSKNLATFTVLAKKDNGICMDGASLEAKRKRWGGKDIKNTGAFVGDKSKKRITPLSCCVMKLCLFSFTLTIIS